MLVKNTKGIQAMGYLLEASGFPSLLTNLGALLTWVGLVYISVQQVQGSQSFRTDCSKQLMFGCVCQPGGDLLRQIQSRSRSYNLCT